MDGSRQTFWLSAPGDSNEILAGVVTAFDAGGQTLFTSPESSFQGPGNDAAVALDLTGSARLRAVRGACEPPRDPHQDEQPRAREQGR